jgi:hypothetical protein
MYLATGAIVGYGLAVGSWADAAPEEASKTMSAAQARVFLTIDLLQRSMPQSVLDLFTACDHRERRTVEDYMCVSRGVSYRPASP